MEGASERSAGNHDALERMGCNVDFGNGHSLELDYRKPEGPWLSNGPGIGNADVWFKGNDGIPDVRIHIERTEDGLKLQIDRGQQSSVWWPADSPPQLRISFDQDTRTATASASVGQGDDFQEVALGTMPF